MKFKLTLLSFFILSISNSNAQSLKVGLEAGGSVALGKISTLSPITITNTISYTGLRLGVRLGLPLQYQLAKGIALHSGFYYTMKGVSKHENSILGLVYNSLELPLGLVYTSSRKSASNFFVGGGGYLGYAIHGKIHSYYVNGQKATEDIKFGNTILQNDMRRLDYGLHFQTGLAFQNGLLLRFVAQRQLNDMAIKNNGFGLNEIKSQAYIAITMAYLL